MPVEADVMSQEADAHADRMESEAWLGPGRAEGLQLPEPAPDAAPGGHVDQDVLARLDVLARQVATLTSAVAQLEPGQHPSAALPPWLLEAAGDPRTYDGPDAGRVSVCVRVRPDLHDQLRRVQARLGLRSGAGTWEVALRLGLAALDRFPEP